MFKKILIANRGEIACRIIKTARRMGVLTVAVYSDADADALHVSMADEAIHIGAAPAKDSYLQMDNIIQAAQKTGAQAIHPGYGFLSENAQFCQQCIDNDIVFIGPPVDAIAAMGSKSAAKNIMAKAGVPLVPGYHGDDQTTLRLKQAADAMGYPVLLKPSAGGGGKGMRQVWSAEEFEQQLTAAKREALNAFSNDVMLIEKYLTQPRHVEIQIFCDQYGNAVYLGERDCSVQRRHQKIIEEAPAPGMRTALRQQMGTAAINAAQAIAYQGAGTVEFLLDKDGAFYFMEMNTRLQVEHPVTEMITGQDLVEWQLRIAAGEPLPLQQSDLQLNGHAFEARIYAEDPDNDFLPVTGLISYLQAPVEDAYTRVDTGVRQGDRVSVHYDPMIAKLIVWDENRDKALQRLGKALTEYRISGLSTNISFLYNLATSAPFSRAELDTGFIDKHQTEIFHADKKSIDCDIHIAALYLLLQQQHQALLSANKSTDPTSPWHQANGWRLNEISSQQFHLLCHGQEISVEVEQVIDNGITRYFINTKTERVEARGSIDGDRLNSDINGYRSQATVAEHDGVYSVYRQQSAFQFRLLAPDIGEHSATADHNSLYAPMNGTVVELLLAPGSEAKQQQALLVMEAMKMEHTIRAPADGKVLEYFYQPGDLVDGGAELLAFEAK